MNILYSILTHSLTSLSSSSYYYKARYASIQLTPKAQQLCESVLANVDAARIPLFACVVCHGVLSTQFGDEIKALDTENTYVSPVPRDPSLAATDNTSVVWNLTESPSALRRVYRWLDTDILDRLTVPSWIDIMAAVCLQLLREVA